MSNKAKLSLAAAVVVMVVAVFMLTRPQHAPETVQERSQRPAAPRTASTAIRNPDTPIEPLPGGDGPPTTSTQPPPATSTAPPRRRAVAHPSPPAVTVPTITAITPEGFYSSTSPQSIVIQGGTFAAGATVTLRNVDTSAVFSNQPITSLVPSQIIVNAVISSPGTWSVEVVNPGNLTSTAYQFGVVGGCMKIGWTFLDYSGKNRVGESVTFKLYIDGVPSQYTTTMTLTKPFNNVEFITIVPRDSFFNHNLQAEAVFTDATKNDMSNPVVYGFIGVNCP